jgi:hypothetical protein
MRKCTWIIIAALKRTPRARWSALAAVTVMLIFAFAPGPAHADTVLFQDTLQDPSTSLAPFVPVIGPFPFGGGPTGSQKIIADPLGDGNALTFGAITFQGDIVTSNSFTSPSGIYNLTFQYLGTCGLPASCGVIIGAPTSQNTTHGWLASDKPSFGSDIYGPVTELTDNALAWQTASITFSSSVPVYIALEDFENAGFTSTGGHIPGPESAWYKNVVLTAVPAPEPGTLSLISLGLLGLGAARRRKVA